MYSLQANLGTSNELRGSQGSVVDWKESEPDETIRAVFAEFGQPVVISFDPNYVEFWVINVETWDCAV